MNRSWVSKFAGLVLVLTLISSSLVAGTYAKYTTEYTGTDTVTVARWSAELDYNSAPVTDSIAFSLFGTAWGDSGVHGTRLAPGTEGSFTLAYDMTETQVAHSVTIEMAAPLLATDLPFLKFYTATGAAITVPTSGAITLFTDNYGPTEATSGSAVVYWEWPFDNSNDTDDTADGIAADSYPIAVTFSAIQLDEYPAP